MKGRVEAVTPPAIVERLLGSAGDQLVLVGGQALAFWVDRFGIRQHQRELPAISNDVDFFTLSPSDKAAVERLAATLHGQSQFPPARAMTALVGQAIRNLRENEYLNVDVISRVVGFERRGKAVFERAVLVENRAVRFKVMHPLDVLRSRTANLHKLREKQNDKGAMQLVLAIAAAREFQREQFAAEPRDLLASGRSPLQAVVSECEQLACEDAARKIAKRWHIHVADAIDPLLIPAGPFWRKRWPGLRELMSGDYRGDIESSARFAIIQRGAA